MLLNIFSDYGNSMPSFNFDGSAIAWIAFIMMIIGGLGLFLYGIELTGDSLKAIAGDRLKTFIEKSTNTPIKGILIGAIVTILLQSSSGTTALTVSLVRAGLLSFPQAVGIIMGANIGTTITPFMMSLKIEVFALWFVGIGALMIFFFKKVKVKQTGSMLLGFGLLFLGLWFMGNPLKEILSAYEEPVRILFSWLENWPIFGLLLGTLITALVQSSAATILILQTLLGAGSISMAGALPILLGCNIGTTVTALIASFGGGTEAKRTAFVHSLFNIMGSILFFILTIAGPGGKGPFTLLMEWVDSAWFDGTNKEMTLAFAHIFFNVLTTFILYFFINQMVRLTNFIIHDQKDEREKIVDELLDYSLINKSSVLALSFVKKAINYMAECVREYVGIAEKYSFEQNDTIPGKGLELEKTINCLDKRIHDYLIKLTITDLDQNSSTLLSKYLDLIKDLERIGDHCTNIVEFFKERYDKDMHLSDDGAQDLQQMYSVLTSMIDGTVISLIEWDGEKAILTAKYENEIDRLEDFFHERHVHRVNSGACTVINAEHYVEILSNVERMGDHLKNILDGIMTDEYCKYDEFNH